MTNACQLVSESLTGFIFVMDAQGCVEFVCDSSSEQVGHASEQIKGNQIYNFLHPILDLITSDLFRSMSNLFTARVTNKFNASLGIHDENETRQ